MGHFIFYLNLLFYRLDDALIIGISALLMVKMAKHAQLILKSS